MEPLSDASFLGKLLVLPENVRLDWKGIAWYKHSSLFGLDIINEGKSFITLTPDVNFIKHFPLSLTTRPNKLDRLSLETLSSQVIEFASKVQML